MLRVEFCIVLVGTELVDSAGELSSTVAGCGFLKSK